jgi:hypothetical protein
MFEYHAWVTVQSSAGDEEDTGEDAAFEAVEREIQSLDGGTTAVSLRWVNGMAQLHMSGFLNHASGEGQQVVDTFRRVGQVAPGSYGLLYIRDDEDPQGRRNEFQVIVMRRGQTFTEKDSFLSPCIPVIEDEYVDDDE